MCEALGWKWQTAWDRGRRERCWGECQRVSAAQQMLAAKSMGWGPPSNPSPPLPPPPLPSGTGTQEEQSPTSVSNNIPGNILHSVSDYVLPCVPLGVSWREASVSPDPGKINADGVGVRCSSVMASRRRAGCGGRRGEAGVREWEVLHKHPVLSQLLRCRAAPPCAGCPLLWLPGRDTYRVSRKQTQHEPKNITYALVSIQHV